MPDTNRIFAALEIDPLDLDNCIGTRKDGASCWNAKNFPKKGFNVPQVFWKSTALKS
jgi:hypothetical protein